MYKIAEENGKIGHSNQIQAQINLGLKQGYNGFNQEKIAVLNFLTDLYKEAINSGNFFIPFVVKDTIITYAYSSENGPVAAHEPALLLISDKSPLYAVDQTEKEWKVMVEDYAFKLGLHFKQFRVYVTYTNVEIKIFQQS